MNNIIFKKYVSIYLEYKVIYKVFLSFLNK